MFKKLITLAAFGCIVMGVGAQETYDYDFKATVFAEGEFYGTRRGNEQGKKELNSYYTVLADKTLSADGSLQPGGTYYAFDMYGLPPVDSKKILPPDGTYNFATSPALWTLLNNSKVYILDGNGNHEVEREFTSGKMVISTTEKDGNSYINYDATLTDELGYTHHVTYSSRFVSYTDESQGPGYLEKDLDVKAVYASGRFNGLSNDGQTMQVTLTFSDIPRDGEGDEDFDYLPGTNIYLQAYMPYDPVTGISNGEYPITVDYGPDFTLADGEIVREYGVEYAVGSYAEYINVGQTLHWGVFRSGKLTVSGEGADKQYVAEFTDALQNTIKLSYTGEININKMPFSTLTENVTLDLEGARCIGHYFGDTYREQGSTWLIDFKAAEGKQDTWISEIVSRKMWFNSGICTDTYTAAPNNNLWGGNYKRGQRIDGTLIGTWYEADFDSDGVAHTLAPATSGDLNITKHDDGTYTFSFCFDDGMGHTWSGEWTGTPELINMTDEPDYGEGGIGMIDTDDLNVQLSAEGVATFSQEAQYALYDALGRSIVAGRGYSVNIPEGGIFFLRIGEKTLKVVR